MTMNPLLTNNELEIIEFLIDEKQSDGSTYSGRYAINVAKVLEIIRMPQVTAMPGTHDPALMGSFNLRGRVMPLLNLATWLGKEMIVSSNDKVLVTEFCGVKSAFLVSSVTSIHRLAWDRIEPPNKYVQAFSRDSITGILRIEDRVLFILDMEKILSSLDKSLDMSRMEPENIVEMPEQVRLLLADDSSSLRKIVKAYLEKSGYQVTTASNGKEAWEYLSRLAQTQSRQQEVHGPEVSEIVDLVISDIEMPGNGRPCPDQQDSGKSCPAQGACRALFLADNRCPARQGHQGGRGPPGFQARPCGPGQDCQGNHG